MYRFHGLDSDGNYKFSLIKNNKTFIVSNKFKYYTVKDGDYVICEKSDKSPFKGVPKYDLGDIIFINNPDRDCFVYDGLKLRKATQYEFDKYEFKNFPNISCNASIYQFLMSFY